MSLYLRWRSRLASVLSSKNAKMSRFEKKSIFDISLYRKKARFYWSQRNTFYFQCVVGKVNDTDLNKYVFYYNITSVYTEYFKSMCFPYKSFHFERKNCNHITYTCMSFAKKILNTYPINYHGFFFLVEKYPNQFGPNGIHKSNSRQYSSFGCRTNPVFAVNRLPFLRLQPLDKR